MNSVCILVYSWIKANYHQFEDWYSIHKADVLKKGGRMLFDAYPSLPAALKAAFPEFPWDPSRFARHKSLSAQQLRELDQQREIFNGVSHKVGVSKVRFQFCILNLLMEGSDGRLVWSLKGRGSQSWRRFRVDSVPNFCGCVTDNLPRSYMGTQEIQITKPSRLLEEHRFTKRSCGKGWENLVQYKTG